DLEEDLGGAAALRFVEQGGDQAAGDAGAAGVGHHADGKDLRGPADDHDAGPAVHGFALGGDVVAVPAVGELAEVAVAGPGLGAEHLALVGHHGVDVGGL